MEIAGLPLHPLVVHAVVVFAPLAALFALAYAVVPRWRWALRWVLVACTAVAVVTATISTMSGEELLETLPGLDELPSMETHEERGELLRNALFLFSVIVGLAAWRLGGPSGLVSGRGAKESAGGALDGLLAAALVAASLAVAVLTFLAGHTGAVVVWG
jgi:uncharacterized membrane protein